MATSSEMARHVLLVFRACCSSSAYSCAKLLTLRLQVRWKLLRPNLKADAIFVHLQLNRSKVKYLIFHNNSVYWSSTNNAHSSDTLCNNIILYGVVIKKKKKKIVK